MPKKKPHSSPSVQTPSATPASTIDGWRAFESAVVSYFRLKGFLRVTHDIVISARQTDILLAGHEEHVGRVFVECKYHESPTSKVDVVDAEDFVSRANRLRDNGIINVAYLVTNTEFTAHAKALVESGREKSYALMRTLDELYRSLVNFDPYLERFVEGIRDARAEEWYEPLSAYSLTRPGEGHEGVEEVLKRFLSDDKSRVLYLLGDYGTGKTSTCRHLMNMYAQRYLRARHENRIPALIPLSYFNAGSSLTGLILKFLQEDVGSIGPGPDAFRRMNAEGLLLLFLDGFDEMAKRVTRSVREESIRALSELMTSRSKIVITGRPNYFSTREELVTTAVRKKTPVSFEGIQAAMSGGSNDSGRAEYDFYAIAPLTNSQVESFLRRRFRVFGKLDVDAAQARAKQSLEFLLNTYNLRDLADRPILLEMISVTFAQTDFEQISDAAALYRKYTGLWLDIDSEKGDFRRLVTTKDRSVFSTVLAAAMVQRGPRIHYNEVQKLVAKYFRIDEEDEVDQFSNDIRTCTFLSRDDKGYYSFAHRSFFEFFVALYMQMAFKGKLPKSVHLEEELFLGDIERELPNAFYFFYLLTRAPLTPRHWLNVRRQLDLALDESWAQDIYGDIEHLIEELGGGGVCVEELQSVVTSARDAHRAIVRRISSARAAGVKDSRLEKLRRLVAAARKPV